MTDPSLLVTGDLHLGRHPTRVPAELDGQQFSPAAVWRATVDAALERDVDAVLVSGDVVDRENRFVEAYGDFERGAARLADAGVPLLAVAGNHDHDVLPELVDSLDHDGVELLGADGRWERHTIRDVDGEPICVVDGWSFPSEHVLTSPLDAYDPDGLAAGADGTGEGRSATDAGGVGGTSDAGDAGGTSDAGDAGDAGGAAGADDAGVTDGVPVLGLLHADLDARDSDYAPVTVDELHREPVDAWILGHVHAPAVRVASDPLVCYPGSPQPLDPGEPGTHGPWLVTGASGADSTGQSVGLTAEQLPLATLRYDEIAVDVADAEATTDVTPAVHGRLEEHVREDVPADELELLLARVRLRGRTPVHGDLAAERTRVEEQLGLRPRGLPVRVESLALETRPAVDLESLAGGETPVAYLAELLLALEGGERPARGGDRADEGSARTGDSERADHSKRIDDDSERTGDDNERTGDDSERTDHAAPAADEHAQLVDDALDRLREARGASAYARLHREGRLDQPDRSDAVEALTRQARLLLDELLEQREERA